MKAVHLEGQIPVALVVDSKEELEILYILLNVSNNTLMNGEFKSSFVEIPDNADHITTEMYEVVNRLLVKYELKDDQDG